jgi:two-component system chemotaxis response regulator CheB
MEPAEVCRTRNRPHAGEQVMKLRNGGGNSSRARNGARARRAHFDMVAMVASTGGIEAVSEILAALPVTFPVPIAIVIHRGMSVPNYQASVIGRRTALPVRFAERSLQLKPGTVYLAPPHLHLTVGRDRRFDLVDGRRIRHLRSSANPLFASAAEVFGPRLLAVVLTGMARDGTDGVQTVRRHGGMVIAQDEASCEEFSMPRSAIATGCVDLVLPLVEIGPALVRLTQRHPEPVPGRAPEWPPALDGTASRQRDAAD